MKPLSAASMTAKGMGKSIPVADNATADGRQKNRRVELIISGKEIGSGTGA
jgi:outer membrane protein OmpA-like peptidoglycan-associated protein